MASNTGTGRQNTLQAALDLAGELGFHVLPMEFKEGVKKGLLSQKYSESGQPWGASNDENQIRNAWKKFPHAQLAIACGPASGVWVVEGDIKNDVDGVKWLEEEFLKQEGELPKTLMQRSPSGSVHYLFAWPSERGIDIRNSQSAIAPGVDVRGNGGMIAATPSCRPDGCYEWLHSPEEFELSPAPEWLVEMALNASKKPAKKIKHDDPDSMLPSPEEALLPQSVSRGSKEIEFLIRGMKTDGRKHDSVRDFAAAMASRGAEEDAVRALVAEHCPVFDENVDKLITSAYEKFYRPKSYDGEPLVKDHRGRVKDNVANFMLILQQSEDWCGVLVFDEMARRFILNRPIPGQERRGFKPRPLHDNDFTLALCWFNRNGFPSASENNVTKAIKAVAYANGINPCVDYLTSLKWDGVKRIDKWLSLYCMVDNTPYTCGVGRRWLISAVARAIEPGCKVDTVLILEGPQGTFKSTALRILAGDQWYGDQLPDIKKKDSSQYVRGKWIIELAEITHVNKADTEALKFFLTRQEEDFRDTYGKVTQVEPRQFVFAGTTNREDYLHDSTGNRRFWPVKVRRKIDLEGLKRDRDQIWAEAVDAYRSGEKWYLSEELEALAQDEQAQRSAEDTWDPDILAHVAVVQEVSTKEILEDVFGVIPREQQQRDKLRVSESLRRLGWTPRGRYTAGKYKGLTRFVRCET